MKTQEWDVVVIRQSVGLPASQSPRSRFAPTCLNIDRHWQMLSSYVTAIRFLRVPMDTAWHMTRHKPIDRHRVPGFRARRVLMPSARLPNTVTLLPCHDAHTHPNYRYSASLTLTSQREHTTEYRVLCRPDPGTSAHTRSSPAAWATAAERERCARCLSMRSLNA